MYRSLLLALTLVLLGCQDPLTPTGEGCRTPPELQVLFDESLWIDWAPTCPVNQVEIQACPGGQCHHGFGDSPALREVHVWETRTSGRNEVYPIVRYEGASLVPNATYRVQLAVWVEGLNSRGHAAMGSLEFTVPGTE